MRLAGGPSLQDQNACHASLLAKSIASKMDPSYSPFLSLPAELRLLVYEIYFLSTAPKPDRPDNILLQRPDETALLSLFLTCRLIHAESYKIAFLKNTFIIRRCFPRDAIRGLTKHMPQRLITSLLFPLYRHHDYDLLKAPSNPEDLEEPTYTSRLRNIFSLYATCRHFAQSTLSRKIERGTGVPKDICAASWPNYDGARETSTG